MYTKIKQKNLFLKHYIGETYKINGKSTRKGTSAVLFGFAENYLFASASAVMALITFCG